MKNKPIIYIDSCCFIDLVKQQVGVLPSDRIDDVWHLKKILEAHRAGDLQVVTSTLSIAECLAIVPGQAVVPTEVQDHFRRMLTSGQYLLLLQQTPRTGRIAQDIRWKHNVVLKGADSIHLSSAIEAKASEFISLDERLKKPKLEEAAKILGAAHNIRLIRPSSTNELPESYRQGDMLHVQ